MPYTLDTNDMRFSLPQGFSHGEDFFQYLRDAFDVLYAEGDPRRPAMLSIGMHCRLLGRPGACGAAAFSDHIERHDRSGCAAASTSRATGSRSSLRGQGTTAMGRWIN